jgi:hypothetical protein
LPRSTVDRSIRERYGFFRVCYEKALADDEHLRASVELTITVDAAGAPQRIQRSDDAKTPAAFADCILASARKFRFPSPAKRAASVTVSILFKSW